MKDYAAFDSQMQRLGAIYNRKIETLLMDTWWEICGTLSDQQFAHGCAVAMQESSRFPTPAVVRAAAYQWKEEQSRRMEDESGIPGVALLTPGPILSAAKREGWKYASPDTIASGLVTPLYTCLWCLDRHHVRFETMVELPHFGQSIPCPRCNGDAYDRYVEKNGIPEGMPKWSGAYP
jgi:hypothetical protein